MDDPYLDHLSSLALDDIQKQPSIIAIEAATIDAELINLCYREYPTFLSVHQCSAAVQSAFDDFDTSLTALLESVPDLERSCSAFTQDTSTLQRHRQRVLSVQDHQTKITELLELPVLMETCIRNGFYQEALDLADHPALQLNNALAKDLQQEVQRVLDIMATLLLSLLCEPVKLATFVKAINHLGRLNIEQLGLVFLHCRLYNYRATVRFEPQLRRQIDLFREHVYDVISQYASLFGSSPLEIVAGQCVDELMTLVEKAIAQMDSASLSSILVQLGYCAMSFARVGLDLGLIVGTPFAAVIETTYAAAVRSATDTFEKTIDRPGAITLFYNAHVDALNALRLLAPLELAERLFELQQASLEEASRILDQYVNSILAPSETPRAHLLRRSTETLLSPSALREQHDEKQKRCLDAQARWAALSPRLIEFMLQIYSP